MNLLENKVVAILVCWFLGCFGVHNFMMGEVKKGIAKIVGLFLCIIPSFILNIIDLVKIITGKYEINKDKFF